MQFKKSTVAIQPEIRKRVTGGDITVPITLDFSAVEANSDGDYVVLAGSPISDAGVVANTADAVGILLTDTYSTRPIGTIIKHGCVNLTVAESNSGLTIDDLVKTALPLVIFE